LVSANKPEPALSYDCHPNGSGRIVAYPDRTAFLWGNPGTGSCEEIDSGTTTVTVTNTLVAIHWG
jgi:hypothetical protein